MGLILSEALKVQKDAEDESSQIAIGNLRSEVITLRNEGLEKDKILLSLVERLKSSEATLSSLSEAEQRMKKAEERQLKDAKRIADLEYALSTLVELHKTEVQELEKKLDEVIENFNVGQTKHEISDIWKLRVQKNVEELHQAKQESYNIAKEYATNLKNSFTKVGTFSSEQNFIRDDPDRVIRWINGEAEAFEEILSDRGDFYAFAGARGAMSVLEKVDRKLGKAVAQPGFSLSANDIKNPSAEATALSGKFYSEVWLKGGREISNKAIKKNGKESHDAFEEARRTKEAIERARLIGISIMT
jgi:hypothetical protein